MTKGDGTQSVWDEVMPMGRCGDLAIVRRLYGKSTETLDVQRRAVYELANDMLRKRFSMTCGRRPAR